MPFTCAIPGSLGLSSPTFLRRGSQLRRVFPSCLLLDAGNFSTYLSEVKTWMDSNPNEVVTLLLVNTDGIDPTVWQAAYVAAGIDTYAYTPTNVPIAYADWPTLQTLITTGKRLVSFLAQNADVSTAPYLVRASPLGVVKLLLTQWIRSD